MKMERKCTKQNKKFQHKQIILFCITIFIAIVMTTLVACKQEQPNIDLLPWYDYDAIENIEINDGIAVNQLFLYSKEQGIIAGFHQEVNVPSILTIPRKIVDDKGRETRINGIADNAFKDRDFKAIFIRKNIIAVGKSPFFNMSVDYFCIEWTEEELNHPNFPNEFWIKQTDYKDGLSINKQFVFGTTGISAKFSS